MYTNFSSLDQSELNTLLTPLQKINCQISPPHPLRRLQLLLPFYFVGYFLLLGQRQGYLSVCSVSLCSLVLPLLSNSRVQFSSVAQLYPTLWRHGLQHARPPCPSPTPRVYSNSCPLSQWCHPTISSSVIPFSSHLQFFSTSRSFPMSQLFASSGQSIGVSSSTAVLPVNIQDWFPLGWAGWISLQSKGLLRIFSNTTIQNHQFFSAQLSL